VSIKPDYIPGRLAHEGTHAVQAGKLPGYYDFISEREAFNAGYAVDRERNLSGAYNPTNDEIVNAYKFWAG
jgi:hypothetical protein